MKTIVASQNAELQRHFERELLRRGDLRVVTAKSGAELLDRMRNGADLCFVDRVLPDGDAATFLIQVRTEKALQKIPVVMVSQVGAPQTGLEAARRDGFAEFIELPAPPGFLPNLVARLLRLPVRSDLRYAVKVHVYQSAVTPAQSPTESYLGTTIDLSEAGLFLRAKQALPAGTEIGIRFTLPAEDEIVATAKVVRSDPRSMAPSVGLALTLTELAPLPKAALIRYLQSVGAHRPFHFDVQQATATGKTEVSFHGVLRGDADLSPLGTLKGPLLFHMREFRRISSDGVQRWIDFIRGLSPATTIELAECPVAFIHQANLITNLLERQKVVSFFAPYMCDACGLEDERLIEVATQPKGRFQPPSFECSSCGQQMSFDDLPEQYFAFLERR